MGLYFLTSAMPLVFGIGVIFEIFHTLGNMEDLIERLKMYVNGFTAK